MKSTVKILILLACVVLAFGGVMIYAKTRVSPPMELKQVNQYTEEYNKCINSLSNTRNPDLTFNSSIDLINVFAREKKIDKEQASKGRDQLVSSYAPIFARRCYGVLKGSSWSESALSNMTSTIATLRGMTIKGDDSALKKSTRDSLAQVENIVGKYHKALAVSQQGGFTSVAAAKSTIAQANQYASDPWLKHCASLVSALHSVSSRIGEAHYSRVVAAVSRLANYRSFSSLESYNAGAVKAAQAAINEYKSASSIYSNRHDTSGLSSKAASYYNAAYNYFKTRAIDQAEEVNDDDNGEEVDV